METVTLKAFDNYFTANILLTRLRDSGIECYLKDEYTITIDPLLSNALGGIKLIVRKENYGNAAAMLRSFEKQEKFIIKCPLCAVGEFIEVPEKSSKNYVQGLLSWLFATHTEPDVVYKCNRCGYETGEFPNPE